MALLDVAIRNMGIEEGEALFSLLRDMVIWLEAPNDLVVIKGFGKIQRLLKDKSNEEKAQEAQTRGHWPMQPTIAYREYVYYRDPFQLALRLPEHAPLPIELSQLLSGINYLGKRGGFVQIMEPPREVEQLPGDRFVALLDRQGAVATAMNSSSVPRRRTRVAPAATSISSSCALVHHRSRWRRMNVVTS